MPSSSSDPATPTTRRPSARSSFCASSTASGERPLMTTDAPSRARRVAVERPMLGLWVDPVTTATVPLKRMPALLSLMFPPWSRPDWRWRTLPEEQLRSAGAGCGTIDRPLEGERAPQGDAVSTPGRDYKIFDADNHYYEVEDTFTRFADEKVRKHVR